MKDTEHVTRIHVHCVGVDETLKRSKFRRILIRNGKTVPANGNGSKQMEKKIRISSEIPTLNHLKLQ